MTASFLSVNPGGTGWHYSASQPSRRTSLSHCTAVITSARPTKCVTEAIHFVKETQRCDNTPQSLRVELDHFLKTVKNMIKLFAAKMIFAPITYNFLNLAKFFIEVRTIAVHRDTVTNLRENKSVDQPEMTDDDKQSLRCDRPLWMPVETVSRSSVCMQI